MDKRPEYPFLQGDGQEEVGARKVDAGSVLQTQKEKLLQQIALLAAQKYLNEIDLDGKAILVFDLNYTEVGGVLFSNIVPEQQEIQDVYQHIPFLTGLIEKNDLKRLLDYLYGEEAVGMLIATEGIPVVVFDEAIPTLFDIGVARIQ